MVWVGPRFVHSSYFTQLSDDVGFEVSPFVTVENCRVTIMKKVILISESLLSAWRKLGSLATYWAHSEDSDQTGRMPRLIWVFAGRTVILLVLSWGGSYLDSFMAIKSAVGSRLWYSQDPGDLSHHGNPWKVFRSKMMVAQVVPVLRWQWLFWTEYLPSTCSCARLAGIFYPAVCLQRLV